MLGEVPEAAATGELATVYQELRHCSGVAYISSLQRHVAAMPGCLEYAWACCRPAFFDGRLPETAWRRASMIPVAPFPPLAEPALRLMGVDAAGVRAIRNICDNFVRVAPINLLFAACFERLIEGARPDGSASEAIDWTPPEMLPPMPEMVEIEAADSDVAAVLMRLATEIGGQPFVPALYRLLAHWPGYFAHAATLVEPLLKSAAATRERMAIANGIVAAADEIIAGLPALPDRPPPTEAQGRTIVDAIRTYRVTSPEMIVFGTLLSDALPPTAA